MALELKKAPAKEKPIKCPKKTGINLARGEKQTSVSTPVIIAAAVVLVLALFVKFGIIDQYAKLNDARNTYDDTHVQYLSSLKAIENKAEVEAEYQHYTLDWMKEGATGYVSVPRVDVLDLVESELMGCGHINSVVVQGSVATVRMTNMTLKDISEMFESLIEHPLVSSVSLDTAQTEGEKDEDGGSQTDRAVEEGEASSGTESTDTESTDTEAQTDSGSETDPGDSLVFVITINLQKAAEEE